MSAGLKLDATIFGQFGIRIRSLIKPESPVKFDKGSITLGIPVLGSVTLFWINKE